MKVADPKTVGNNNRLTRVLSVLSRKLANQSGRGSLERCNQAGDRSGHRALSTIPIIVCGERSANNKVEPENAGFAPVRRFPGCLC